MSIDALNQFRAVLNTDPVLQKACLDAMGSGRQDDLIAMGAAKGFVFTSEDVVKTMDDAELSEFELELTAAGYGWTQKGDTGL